MRRLALIPLCLLAVACGDDEKPATTHDTTDTSDTSNTSIDTSSDTSEDTQADTSALTGCLESPTALPRPSETLPCELIPPGLTLTSL